jgi:alpha-N-acetylglucosaminidase
MGTAFLREQEKLYGTDHLYAADPFHESKPPSDDPAYLQSVAKEVLGSMQAVDREATIVMQTWSLRKPLVRMWPGRLWPISRSHCNAT